MAFDLDKYFDAVDAERTRYPNLRLGQALFNELYNIDVVLANTIRSGNLDPFYYSKPDDPHIVKYLDWLRTVATQ